MTSYSKPFLVTPPEMGAWFEYKHHGEVKQGVMHGTMTGTSSRAPIHEMWEHDDESKANLVFAVDIIAKLPAA